MRAQFDPDVWAALLIIVAIGFGGVLFLDLIVNSLDMHAILNVFDREISIKGLYVVTALSRDDYAVYAEKVDSNFTYTNNYYAHGLKPTRPQKYVSIINSASKTVSKNPVTLQSGDEISGLCGFITDELGFNDQYKNCKNIMYTYEMNIYSPQGFGIAFFSLNGEIKK